MSAGASRGVILTDPPALASPRHARGSEASFIRAVDLAEPTGTPMCVIGDSGAAAAVEASGFDVAGVVPASPFRERRAAVAVRRLLGDGPVEVTSERCRRLAVRAGVAVRARRAAAGPRAGGRPAARRRLGLTDDDGLLVAMLSEHPIGVDARRLLHMAVYVTHAGVALRALVPRGAARMEAARRYTRALGGRVQIIETTLPLGATLPACDLAVVGGGPGVPTIVDYAERVGCRVVEPAGPAGSAGRGVAGHAGRLVEAADGLVGGDRRDDGGHG